MSRIEDALSYCDEETVEAFVSAAESAAFCCMVMSEADRYAKISRTGRKPDGKEPGPHDLGEYRKRIIKRLEGDPQEFTPQSVRVLADELAHKLDRRRDAFDGKSPFPTAPQGVPGRPVQLTQAQVLAVASLKAQGKTPYEIAMSGIMPPSSFYRYWRAGRVAHVGPARELYLAMEDAR